MITSERMNRWLWNRYGAGPADGVRRNRTPFADRPEGLALSRHLTLLTKLIDRYGWQVVKGWLAVAEECWRVKTETEKETLGFYL